MFRLSETKNDFRRNRYFDPVSQNTDVSKSAPRFGKKNAGKLKQHRGFYFAIGLKTNAHYKICTRIFYQSLAPQSFEEMLKPSTNIFFPAL